MVSGSCASSIRTAANSRTRPVRFPAPSRRDASTSPPGSRGPPRPTRGAGSAADSGNLVWTGPQVEAKSSLFSSGVASGGRVRMYAPNPWLDGSSVSHWDSSLSPYEALEPYYRAGVHSLLITGQALADVGWNLAGSAPTTAWILPSSAHGPGVGGAFYTTTLTIANTGTASAGLTLKFLGHDKDGTTGATSTLNLAAGASVTYPDVLGSVFG